MRRNAIAFAEYIGQMSPIDVQSIGQILDGDGGHIHVFQMRPGINGIVFHRPFGGGGKLPQQLIGQGENTEIALFCLCALVDLFENVSCRSLPMLLNLQIWWIT